MWTVSVYFIMVLWENTFPPALHHIHSVCHIHSLLCSGEKAKLPNSQPLFQLSLFVNIFKQNYLGTANTVNPGHYTWLFNKSKHKDLAQFIIDFPGVFFYQDRYEWLFPLLVASCSDKMSILVMTLFSGIIFAVNMWYAI